MAKLLTYGAIGLGCALAILAARLLSQELKDARGRQGKGNFWPIYMFMAFAIILASFGFTAQMWREAHDRNRAEAELIDVRNQAGALADELKARQLTEQSRGEALRLIQSTVSSLLAVKAGAVDQLVYSLSDQSTKARVEVIRKTLSEIDIQLKQVVGVGSPVDTVDGRR